MRLNVLNHGYGVGTKVLFAIVGIVMRQRFPDAARLVFYRADFYGAPSSQLTQMAMRGPSAWTVADRELMAAYVSKINACAFCVGAHTATAARAYRDAAKVAAVLSDPEMAPIEDRLRATLRMLRKVTQNSVSASDMHGVLAAGVTSGQIQDALAVCFAFNVTDRLADAFGFEVLQPKRFEASARYLLWRGYK